MIIELDIESKKSTINFNNALLEKLVMPEHLRITENLD
jgi:hypothetical protein